jgi:hypothetical protein
LSADIAGVFGGGKKNLGPTVFASEYGLEFTDTTEAMFLSATIEAAFEDFPPLWRS